MEAKIYLKTKYLFAAILIASISIFAGGCSKIYNVQNEDLISQITFNNNINDFLSIYEIVEHINSTKASQGFVRNNLDSIEKQANCKLIIIDSTTSDGDGYMYLIKFPDYKKDFNQSALNYDGKARFGSVLVEVSQHYRELNTTSTISIDDTNSFYIGSLNSQVKKFTGKINLYRKLPEILTMSFNQVKMVTDFDSMIFSGQLAIQWTSGGKTDGLFNDVINYNGDGTFSYNNFSNISWKTSVALVKNIENGCSANIVKGILQIDNNNLRYRIDYDPFNNMSCDNIAKIYSAGKEYEIRMQ
jgi:hypothetical protein